jgi:hypothetical protein
MTHETRVAIVPSSAVTKSSPTMTLSIAHATWQRLVEANKRAVQAGWATPGVFGTGVGPEYRADGAGSLLYVGKSAGPLGHAVGSCDDQVASGAASTAWMVGRNNKSALWQSVDKIDRTRCSIAWTNICKMDRVGGQRPPSAAEWSQVANACMAALEEEILTLSPWVTVFATSGIYQSDLRSLLARLEYRPVELDFNDGWTKCSQSPHGRFAIETKHPQGWDGASRNRVIELTVRLLSGGHP